MTIIQRWSTEKHGVAGFLSRDLPNKKDQNLRFKILVSLQKEASQKFQGYWRRKRNKAKHMLSTSLLEAMSPHKSSTQVRPMPVPPRSPILCGSPTWCDPTVHVHRGVEQLHLTVGAYSAGVHMNDSFVQHVCVLIWMSTSLLYSMALGTIRN